MTFWQKIGLKFNSVHLDFGIWNALALHGALGELKNGRKSHSSRFDR